MVEVSVRFVNPKEVINDIEKLRKLLREAINNALDKSANIVKEEAKAEIVVRTGKTRRSIGIDIDRQELRSFVGSNWYISRFLEYGTVKMSARPFLRPALERKKEDIRRIFGEEIENAVMRARA